MKNIEVVLALELTYLSVNPLFMSLKAKLTPPGESTL